MRWVLLAGVTEWPIANEMAKIFTDDVETRIVKMSDMVVTNYGNEKQVRGLIREIDSNFNEWHIKKYKKRDEVYIPLVGGNLQLSVLIRRLNEAKVPYDLLVYEKKLKRYVIIKDIGNGNVIVR